MTAHSAAHRPPTGVSERGVGSVRGAAQGSARQSSFALLATGFDGDAALRVAFALPHMAANLIGRSDGEARSSSIFEAAVDAFRPSGEGLAAYEAEFATPNVANMGHRYKDFAEPLFGFPSDATALFDLCHASGAALSPLLPCAQWQAHLHALEDSPMEKLMSVVTGHANAAVRATAAELMLWIALRTGSSEAAVRLFHASRPCAARESGAARGPTAAACDGGGGRCGSGEAGTAAGADGEGDARVAGDGAGAGLGDGRGHGAAPEVAVAAGSAVCDASVDAAGRCAWGDALLSPSGVVALLALERAHSSQFCTQRNAGSYAAGAGSCRGRARADAGLFAGAAGGEEGVGRGCHDTRVQERLRASRVRTSAGIDVQDEVDPENASFGAIRLSFTASSAGDPLRVVCLDPLCARGAGRLYVEARLPADSGRLRLPLRSLGIATLRAADAMCDSTRCTSSHMSLLLAEETLSLVMSYDDTVQWDSAVAVAHATRTTFAAGSSIGLLLDLDAATVHAFVDGVPASTAPLLLGSPLFLVAHLHADGADGSVVLTRSR